MPSDRRAMGEHPKCWVVCLPLLSKGQPDVAPFLLSTRFGWKFLSRPKQALLRAYYDHRIYFHSIRMEKDFPWDPEAVHAYSENLFGSSRRLEIALAILFVSEQEPHNLYKQALANRLGIGDGLVEKHLEVFRKAGLLEKHPKPPQPPGKRGRGAPRVVFRRTSDEFWHCLQRLGERFRRPPPSASAQKKAKFPKERGVRESSG